MNVKHIVFAVIFVSATAHQVASACPQNGQAVTLVSTPSDPLTETDIQNAIASISSGTVYLSGQFMLDRTIVLKNCVALTTREGDVVPASLVWSDTTQPGRAINGEVNSDISITSLQIVGRGISIGCYNCTGSNYVLRDVQFINPTTSAPDGSEGFYIVKLIGGSNWTVTGNTITFDRQNPSLNGVGATGIIGWSNANLNLSSNTFRGVGEPVHLFALTNSMISNNVASDLSSQGIEIQGNATDTHDNQISDNRLYNWVGTPNAIGMSIAGGANISVLRNTVIYKGYDNSACDAYLPSPTGSAYGSWGMEFSAANSTAALNIICGFNSGIAIGLWDQKASGLDTMQVIFNWIQNVEVGLFAHGPGSRSSDGQKLTVQGNYVKDARVSGFSTQSWWDDSYSPRITAFSLSELSGLTIQDNVFIRQFGLYSTDGVWSQWNVPFTGILVTPIASPENMTISGNAIAISGTLDASKRPNAKFVSIALGIVSDDYGNNRGPQSPYLGSIISSNLMGSIDMQFGTGVSVVPANSGGLNILSNQFINLISASNASASLATFSGNTCHQVQTTDGCQ